MRYLLLEKICNSSINEIRPLHDVYEWLDYLDYCDENDGLKSRHSILSGFYEAKLTSIHKCSADENLYYVFIFALSLTDFGKVYFQYTTKAFDPQRKEQNAKLFDVVTAVLGGGELLAFDEANINKLIDKSCLVHIQEYEDWIEKFIYQCFPLDRKLITTKN